MHNPLRTIISDMGNVFPQQASPHTSMPFVMSQMGLFPDTYHPHVQNAAKLLLKWGLAEICLLLNVWKEEQKVDSIEQYSILYTGAKSSDVCSTCGLQQRFCIY